jgi:predicted DNA-binding transcriptional regulator AlpA
MTSDGKRKPKNRGARRAQTEQRLRRTLELFPSLPDEALVDVRVVAAIRGRSVPSTWRDVAAGRLAEPVKIGPGSTRWTAGNVRASMKGDAA